MSLVGVIYKIHSELCDDIYIGSSRNFANRRRAHRNAARSYKCGKLYCKPGKHFF